MEAEAPIHTVGIALGMDTTSSFLLCTLGAQTCAFPLAIVKRVLRAAAVTPLPRVPQGVLGVVNMAGQLTPVFTLRPRLGLPARALDPNDRFVVTQTAQFSLIFVMDTVVEVRDHEPERDHIPRHVVSKMKNFAGIECLADGLIVVNNINSLFSMEEEQLLLSTLSNA